MAVSRRQETDLLARCTTNPNFADELGEAKNLAAAMPDKVAEMQALLVGDRPFTRSSADTPALRRGCRRNRRAARRLRA